MFGIMKEEWIKLKIGTMDVPVQIIREKRRSIRASMGKDNVIMRFPVNLPAEEEAAHRKRLTNWLEQQYEKKEGLFQRYQKADYQDGDTLRVGDRQYELRLRKEDRKTSAASLKRGQILLRLNRDLDEQQASKAIRTLLSRVIGADYLPDITRRVLALNEQHFRRPIKGVKLKYNHSNWGSCSNSGNINLSTRLLFAPQEVVDYVIIHELAHLIELNHSHRFWAEVARAMPDYEQKEAWLKEFGAGCDF
jgi:hypothetical protein